MKKRLLPLLLACLLIFSLCACGPFGPKEPEPDDFALVFREDGTLLCRPEAEDISLPRMRDGAFRDAQYAFSIDEDAYYLAACEQDVPGFEPVRAAALRGMTEQDLFTVGLCIGHVEKPTQKQARKEGRIVLL